MNTDVAVSALGALAHAHRLEVFRLLVRLGPEAIAAGEIATHVGIGATAASFHLKELERAGLIRGTRDGRHIRYGVNVEGMRGLLAFLMEDCCQGEPDLCGMSTTKCEGSEPVTHVNDRQRIAGEFIGTALLLATVVGSGIMAEALAGGNVAIALLGNTIPTGAILVVLISLLGPVSGAHFNPAVTGVFAWRGELPARLAALYVLAQIAGGIAGVIVAHAMFDLPLVQLSAKMRSSSGQWFSEFVATFGLLFVILGTLHRQADTVPLMVGLYITAAYWFTASTNFANPAVTIARCLTNSFAGIAPADAPAFIVAQLAGAVAGALVANWIFKRERAKP